MSKLKLLQRYVRQFSGFQKEVGGAGDILFHHIFYSTPHIQCIISTCNQSLKVIHEIGTKKSLGVFFGGGWEEL